MCHLLVLNLLSVNSERNDKLDVHLGFELTHYPGCFLCMPDEHRYFEVFDFQLSVYLDQNLAKTAMTSLEYWYS